VTEPLDVERFAVMHQATEGRVFTMYDFAIVALLALATVKAADFLCDDLTVLERLRSLVIFVLAVGSGCRPPDDGCAGRRDAHRGTHLEAPGREAEGHVAPGG
jgi:hypothetical protein